MRSETIMRARNNAILNKALQEGRANNMNELETFEALVHMLLNWQDEVWQRELDRRMNSAEPLIGQSPQ